MIRRGCQPCWGGGGGGGMGQHTKLPNFPKNYMKFRNFRAVGGGGGMVGVGYGGGFGTLPVPPP